jgi:hypothetical protein
MEACGEDSLRAPFLKAAIRSPGSFDAGLDRDYARTAPNRRELVKKQSFEDYYYKNIHAEGCGCSELVINNFEIDRRSDELRNRGRNPIGALIGWARRLLRSRKRI